MYRGVLITADEERYGYLIPEERKFEESRIEYADYVFSPTFFNAHTHLGDAAFKEAPVASLDDLVGPKGYKHRMLKTAEISELREFAAHEVCFARAAGTSHFLDFREGGASGLKVVKGLAGILPLARPASVDEAAKIDAFGFAMSSTRDHDIELVEGVRKVARKRGLIFAIHAGEKDCYDVDSALALEPDLIVHMNACPEKLKDVFDAGTPIVSCIRSNAFFGLMRIESYRIMKDYEFWMIGTDNAMIASASMLDEMHFASYIIRDDAAVFKAATRGYEIFDVDNGYVVFHRKGVFRRTNNILSTLVRRACFADIETVILP